MISTGRRRVTASATALLLLFTAACSDDDPVTYMAPAGEGDGAVGSVGDGDGDGTGGTGDGDADGGGGDGDAAGDGDGDDGVCDDPNDCLPHPSCTGATFAGTFYYFCTEELTRDDAATACQGVSGGALVEIDTAEEDAFVRDNASIDSWIGANAQAVAGDWVWNRSDDVFWRGNSGGAAIDGAYTGWIAGHPTATACAIYFPPSMGWSALSCASEKGFICERLDDRCPDDPDKLVPGICGCGVADRDQDGDTYLDCEEECPLDVARTRAGDCGCVGGDDVASDGASCDDGYCPANDACDGEGRCGDPLECCSDGADTDGDSLPDCAELGDNSPWTDPNVFNGMRVRHLNSCDGTPGCSEFDSLGEVDGCIGDESVQETLDQYAGWDFQDAPDDITASGYGFMPPFVTGDNTWQAEWSGFVYLQTAGLHCFGITGATSRGCGTLFFDDNAQPLQTGGQVCHDLEPGIYPIRWHYVMDDGGDAKSMHVNYCAGGDAPCTPTAVLPSSMLRPESPCGPSCLQDGDVCTVHVCHLDGICEARATPGDPPCPDDGDVCTLDVCSAGACGHPAVPNDTPCADDGLECTRDVCTGGVCGHPNHETGAPCANEGGVGSECTQDICDGGACTHPPTENDLPCDMNPCIDNQVCRGGFCVAGTAKDCSDGKSCTNDTCDQGNGNCQNSLNNGFCDIGGVCYADGDPDPDNTCQHCDSGASCGFGCSGRTRFVDRPNGASCTADNLFCTTHTCSGGGCQQSIDTGCLINSQCIPQGDEDPGNECRHCQGPATGYTNKADGTACAGGTCTGGSCG